VNERDKIRMTKMTKSEKKVEVREKGRAK